MKRYWICIVVALFVLTALPVSATGNQPAVTLTVEEQTVNPGTDTVEVCFYYDTTEYLLDGVFVITFPSDKVQLLIEGMSNPMNPAGSYIFLPGSNFNATFASEGQFIISFVDSSASCAPGTGQIAKLPFKILDPAVGGDYTIHIQAQRLVKWVEGVTAGENLVSDDTPIEASGILHVAPDPDATHTTITERFTSFPTETTTLIPTETTTPTTQTTSIFTAQETTTVTFAVTTTRSPAVGGEMTTTTELPTTQPAEGVDATANPKEESTFPWWGFLVAAVVGAAVLIPLAIKLRKR